MPSQEGSKKRNIFKREIKKTEEEEEGNKEEEGDKEDDDIEIDIASHGERPSVRAKLSMAAKAGISNRPRIPHEPPCLYRIYKATSQRVPLHLSQLNSIAAFILICDHENRVLIWLGSNCPDSDITFAKEMGLEIFRRDMRNYDATEITDIIWEGRENEKQSLLKILLDECGSDEGAYRGKKTIAERKNDIENQPLCMSVVEKMPDGMFELLEIGYATPNESGGIGRIPFCPIEVDTIVLTSIENQWDIWIARGNSPEDEEAALRYVVSIAAARADSSEDAARGTIRILRQGCERVTYRRYFKVLTDFEPPGRTLPWSTTTVKKKSEKTATRPTISKRFALDSEKDDDYGAPLVESGYDFISGIFGGIEAFRPSLSVDVPYRGSSNNLSSRSIGEASHEEKAGVQDTIDLSRSFRVEPVIKEEDEEDEEKEPEDCIEIEGSARYVNESDVYDMEAEGLEVESVPTDVPIITKLTEGRALLTKPMLDFVESEQLSPEERIALLADAVVNPAALVGWQVLQVAPPL